MSRRLFVLPSVGAGDRVLIASTTGGTPAEILPSGGGGPVAGSVLSAGPDGSLPRVFGPNDGTATLYLFQVNYLGTRTGSPTTLTGVDPGAATALATSPDVAAAVAALVGGAPADRDTFGEVGALLSALPGAYAPVPSASAPASPVTRQMWKSSRYQDVRISNSPADRRKVILPALSFEGNVVQEPSVWVANGLYNMVYTGGTGTAVLCYASCPLTSDPTVAANWTKNSTKVLGGGVGGYAGGLYHGNLYVEGSTLYYYYVDQATNATIRLATAPASTPTVWTDQGVVMTLPYTAVGFGNTFLLKIGSTYYLIFEMSIANWQLGIATGSTPTGTFTAIQSTMNSLWPGSGNWSASGPWAAVEDGLVVLYYHSGPAVSGSLPTEIYRATIPLASFGVTDTWTIANNKKPILRRAAPEEVDQVADAFVVTNPAGQSYVFWEGYDNAQSKASIFCQPLLPVERVYDGSNWTTITPSGDTAPPITSPGKPAAATLAADYSNATTSFTTALSCKFTPTGTKAVVTLAGTGSNSTNVTNLFNINQGSTNVPLGQVVASTGGNQFFFGGIAIFTNLTPGVTYTFNAQAKVASGTFSCRPASFPNNEQMSLKVEDLAYPSSSSI